MKQGEYSNQYKECKVSPIIKTKIRLVLIAVIGDCRSPILHIANEYEHRFGIESSY